MQDWGRAWPSAQYRTYIRQTASRGAAAHSPTDKRPSLLDPYEDSLLKRWSQGCRNAALLFREISVQGFQGSTTMVWAYVSYLRTYPTQAAQPPIRKQCAASALLREIRWLLVREKEKLDQEDQAKLQRLLNNSTGFRKVYDLL